MKKKELADGIRLRVGMINQDAKVLERTILWMADRVRGKLITLYCQANGENARGAFIKGIAVDVQNDSVRDLKYADVIGSILDLPDNAGIVSVSKLQSDDEPFIQTSVGQSSVYFGLEAEQVGTRFWQESSRLYFKDLGGEVKQVLVKCIPSISVLDDEDEIPMPYGVEDDLMEEVVKKIFNQFPEDKTDDNRETPV